jgi:fido (protein-threonine AMPylation protein)
MVDVSNPFEPIDGETPIDISGLKDPTTIRTREVLNRAEANNIRKAAVKYLLVRPSKRSAPFDYNWSLRLHREMFGEVWKWAGIPRQSNLNIGVDWSLVQMQLEDLFLGMEYRQPTAENILQDAVDIHYRAVHIHHFHGGNGRWSRFLADIWLKQHGQPVIDWPADVGRCDSEIRREYIDAIRLADTHDFGPLTEIHRRFWTGPQ